MNSFAEALKKANIAVEAPKFASFETFEDVKFPVVMDSAHFYIINQDMLKDANYIRSAMKPLDKEDFREKAKLFEDSKIKQWVLDNADKCYVVDRGTTRRKEGKFINRKEFDQLYEQDTHYGLCCLSYYIGYNIDTRKMKVHVDYLPKTLEAAGIDIRSLDLPYTLSEKYSEDDWVRILDALAERSEFVPISLNYQPHVYWNNYDYFYVGRPECYATLGINLLESEQVMKELKDWTAEGGRINPRVWYFLKQTDDGHWYLKRDLKNSPRPEKARN